MTIIDFRAARGMAASKNHSSIGTPRDSHVEPFTSPRSYQAYNTAPRPPAATPDASPPARPKPFLVCVTPQETPGVE